MPSWLLMLLMLAMTVPAYADVPNHRTAYCGIARSRQVTARVEQLEVPTNNPLNFGTLIVAVRTCRVTPPEATPEAAAFLEVSELKAWRKGYAGVFAAGCLPRAQRFRRWSTRFTISG